jgi:polar amino acid transport system substrate-binding protein
MSGEIGRPASKDTEGHGFLFHSRTFVSAKRAGTKTAQAIAGLMRLLFFFNLIAVVILAAALGRAYQGAPLPWRLSAGVLVRNVPDAVATAQSPNTPVTPEPNPLRGGGEARVARQAGTLSKLRILTEGAYPPFNYRDDEGRLSGFDIDVARELCARIQRDCRIEARRWSELLPALKRGDANAVIASMLIPSPGREATPHPEGIIFTQRYYSTPGHFAARKNEGAAASAIGLAGRRVAVQAGSVHEAFLKVRFPAAVAVPMSTLDAAEAALAGRNVDLLFADRNALLRWTRGGDGALCCRLIGVDYMDKSYFGAGAGIALRADEEGLRNELDAALSGMIADGAYARISARYFGQSIR